MSSVLTVVLLSLAASGPATRATLDLTFGVYQTDKPTVVYAKFIPILERLQEDLEEILGESVAIEIRVYKTYDAGLNALVEGEVDFARFGPASYVLAERKNKNISLLAMEVVKGQKTFSGVIIVRKDSDLECLGDLEGRTFAFGDENSTIGRYLAQAELVKHGVRARDLERYDFLGRHDLVAARVRIGDYDAGSVKIGTFEKENKDDELRILHRFDNVTKPWVGRAGLHPRVRGALTEALVSLDDEALLKQYKVTGFTHATRRDYKLVREGMAQAERLFTE